MDPFAGNIRGKEREPVFSESRATEIFKKKNGTRTARKKKQSEKRERERI